MPRKPKQEFTSAAQAVHSATTAKDPLGTLEIALVHFGAAALAPPLLGTSWLPTRRQASYRRC